MMLIQLLMMSSFTMATETLRTNTKIESQLRRVFREFKCLRICSEHRVTNREISRCTNINYNDLELTQPGLPETILAGGVLLVTYALVGVIKYVTKNAATFTHDNCSHSQFSSKAKKKICGFVGEM